MYNQVLRSSFFCYRVFEHWLLLSHNPVEHIFLNYKRNLVYMGIKMWWRKIASSYNKRPLIFARSQSILSSIDSWQTKLPIVITPFFPIISFLHNKISNLLYTEKIFIYFNYNIDFFIFNFFYKKKFFPFFFNIFSIAFFSFFTLFLPFLKKNYFFILN